LSSVEAEVGMQLERYRKRLALDFNPHDVVGHYIRTLGLTAVSVSPCSLVGGINQADSHVVAAAQQLEAWILTCDLTLVSQCHSTGAAHARITYDVLCHLTDAAGAAIPLDWVARFGGASMEEGYLFAHVEPGAWRSVGGAERHVICDVFGFASLGFDEGDRSWFFRLGKRSIRIACDLQKASDWVLCGSFRAKERGKIEATLRVRGAGEELVEPRTLMRPEGSFARPVVTFGHGAGNSEHWGGTLITVAISSRKMSGTTWKALGSVPGSTPDPCSEDVVAPRLLRWAFSASRVVLPTIVPPSALELTSQWLP
jgi:hypothetical protein